MITREDAKKLMPIMKAYSEGKQVQHFNGKYWEDREYLNFDDEPHNYRIKSKPKYRPFKSVEECFNEMKYHEPFGWVKNKNTNKLYNILTINEDTIDISVEDFVIKPFSAFESFIFADGTPFGIKEEE